MLVISPPSAGGAAPRAPGLWPPGGEVGAATGQRLWKARQPRGGARKISPKNGGYNGI
jgi:hypothetical protein